MIERRNVQIFVYTLNPFKVLILKWTKERSGYYQPVCGGGEVGETPMDTAKREVLEETGIGTYVRLFDLDYTFTYDETKNGKYMHMEDSCFAMEVKTSVPIQLSEEHELYLWCTEEEAREVLNWKHNLIALDRLISMIN